MHLEPLITERWSAPCDEGTPASELRRDVDAPPPGLEQKSSWEGPGCQEPSRLVGDFTWFYRVNVDFSWVFYRVSRAEKWWLVGVISCYSLISPKLKYVGIWGGYHLLFCEIRPGAPQFCMACVHRENLRHDDKAVVSEAAKLMWMKSPVTRLTRWDPQEAGDCMSFLYLSTSNMCTHPGILYAYPACVIYLYIYIYIYTVLYTAICKWLKRLLMQIRIRGKKHGIRRISNLAICPAGCSHIYKQIHQLKVLNYRMPIINIQQQDIHI